MKDKILAECRACGKVLAVPLSAAGKRIRCPGCSAVVAVPAKEPSRPRRKPAGQGSPPSPPGSRRSKPGRPKQPKRRKRQRRPEYDTDDWDDAIEDAYAAPALPKPRKKKKKKSPAPVSLRGFSDRAPASRRRSGGNTGDELTVGDIILCVVCCKIGLIVGFVRVLTGNGGSGAQMIMLSILSPFLLIGLLWCIFQVLVLVNAVAG